MRLAPVNLSTPYDTMVINQLILRLRHMFQEQERRITPLHI